MALGSNETEFELPPGGVIGVKNDTPTFERVVDCQAHDLPGSHSGSLRPRAAVEKADDKAIELEIVIGHPEPVGLRDTLLQVQTDAFATKLLVSLKQFNFVLADDRRYFMGGDRRRRAIAQYPTSLINKPMAFPDMRKSPSFRRFGIRRLQGSYDLSLEPTRLGLSSTARPSGHGSGTALPAKSSGSGRRNS